MCNPTSNYFETTHDEFDPDHINILKGFISQVIEGRKVVIPMPNEEAMVGACLDTAPRTEAEAEANDRLPFLGEPDPRLMRSSRGREFPDTSVVLRGLARLLGLGRKSKKAA